MPAMPLPENAVADAVGALDGMAEDLMTKSGIPGMAVAVVHDGKTVYAKGFGVKNNELPNEGDNRVDADTVFQIASVSKSLSATVVAQQIGKSDVGRSSGASAISTGTRRSCRSCPGSRSPTPL